MDRNFYPFKDISTTEWLESLQKTIPNPDDYTRTTSENITFNPFKLKEQTLHFDYSVAYKNEQFKAKQWDNVFLGYLKNEAQTNYHVLDGLNKGIDAIHLKLPDNRPNFEKLLKGILTDYCRLSLTFEQGAVDFKSLKAVLEQNGNSAAKWQGAFFGLAKRDFDKATQIFPNLYFGVQNRATKLIPQFVRALKESLEILESRPKVRGLAFQIYLTNDYFDNIAGLRAFRFLVGNLFNLLDYPSDAFYIETLTNHTSQADIYKNMLANCTQAMAGILGNCDGLSVTPQHEADKTTLDFALRVSRNIGVILGEEAHFDKVSNPAAGAYYIEYLTQAIAEQTWQRFQAEID